MDRAIQEIKKVITMFEPISLADMDSVSLMNRNDYKYSFHIKKLPEILNQLSEYYRLLEIDGIRGANYKSIYFVPQNY